MLLTPFSAGVFSQNGTVKGTITDANSDETLIGAIVVADSGEGTASLMDGTYSLSLPAGKAQLTVKLIGYDDAQREINIMSPDMIFISRCASS